MGSGRGWVERGQGGEERAVTIEIEVCWVAIVQGRDGGGMAGLDPEMTWNLRQ